MSNEIQYRHTSTGKTLYCVIYNPAGQVWNGSAFETLVVANWGNYDVALTETPASSYRYLASFPAAITTAGIYSIMVFEQAGASPAISDIALASGALFWTGTAEADLLSEQNIRDSMKLAPTAGDPAAGSVDEELDTLLADGGSGARTIVITVDDGTDPLESVKVRVTKGAESYVQITDVNGQVTFNLDDGSWAVALTLTGYIYAGTTLVVDGDETETYSMTQVTFPPSDPGMVTGYLYCYDETGSPEAGVVISLKLYALSGEGVSGDAAVRTAISDANGLVTFVNLFVGATYRVRRGSISQWRENEIPASATSPYAMRDMWGID